MTRAILVGGLGYGDEGKGAVVDCLARTLPGVHTVVRANGGAQAAHNVVTPDGRHHTFRQLGSGSFVPGVQTHHARSMCVDPSDLVTESDRLGELGVEGALGRLTIDARAPLVTPYHRVGSWLREILRDTPHGTCGMGIAEAMADLENGAPDMLVAGDLHNAQLTSRKIHRLRQRKRAELAELLRALPRPLTDPARACEEALGHDDTLNRFLGDCHHLRQRVSVVGSDYLRGILEDGTVIFEGAQGALLDQAHGFYPHVTRSTTTFANPMSVLAECGYPGTVTRIGVCRGYATRHGAGPFVTEDPGLREILPERHNADDGWSGAFRVGWFDLVALRYALEVVGGADGLALTHLDRLAGLGEVRVAAAYRYAGPDSGDLGAFFERESGGCITRILPGDGTDLVRQAALTRRLFRCVPVYRTVPREDFGAFVAAAVGVPLMLTSWGPTATDVAMRVQVD